MFNGQQQQSPLAPAPNGFGNGPSQQSTGSSASGGFFVSQQSQPQLSDTMGGSSIMGGNASDGMVHAYHQQQPQTPMPQFAPQQQQQQQQQLSPHGGDSFGGGSVTRFASPQMQHQHQPQKHDFNPSPQGQPSSGSMSFAQRAAMMRQNQQQHQPQMSQNGMQHQMYGQQQQQPYSQAQQQQNMPTGLSFAERSQFLQGKSQSQHQPQIQQNNMYAQPQGYLHQQQNLQQQSQSQGLPQPRMPQQQQSMQQPQNNSMQQQDIQRSQSQSQSQQHIPNSQGTVVSNFPIGMPPDTPPRTQQPQNAGLAESPSVAAQQSHLLTEATRKVQEHSYYMKKAMERHDLSVVLDRASHLVGELGEQAQAHHMMTAGGGGVGGPSPSGARMPVLSPKNYYELHLRVLEELPALEEYLLSISNSTQVPLPVAPGMITITDSGAPAPPKHSMEELYDYIQYCPNVLSRLYLQITVASALMRSNSGVGAKWILHDLVESVKCVQNPVRGLFLRHYLLQAVRSRLPDASEEEEEKGKNNGDDRTKQEDEEKEETVDLEEESEEKVPSSKRKKGPPPPQKHEEGTIRDSYQFILANFIEMNKLWVRIQHLPGDGKSKEVRRRRERERNELRILVGTNLVRLSQLDGVTSKVYGEELLPQILNHIVVCNDPLAQAYLMDCIVQVFPDEYHIETLSILLGVCPKLRDKVNIRTILQSLMERLANYLADEELLDETDTNHVKESLARDSFPMFEDCVQKVYNARGPKLTPREVIRLQTALLAFVMKSHQGNRDFVVRCLGACVSALQQVGAFASGNLESSSENIVPPMPPLDAPSVVELEKLLSIPLDTMALGVLRLEHYSDLISFLPWLNRRQVARTLIQAVSASGVTPHSVSEVKALFQIIAPVLRKDPNPSLSQQQQQQQQQQNQQQQQMYGQQHHQHHQEQQHYGRSSMVMSQQMSFNQQMGGMQLNGAPPAVDTSPLPADQSLVSKLVHLLQHDDTDVLFEMLTVAHSQLNAHAGTLVAIAVESLRLAKRIRLDEVRPIGEVDGLEQSVEDSLQGSSQETEEKEGEEPQMEEQPNAGEGSVETPSPDGELVDTEEQPSGDTGAKTDDLVVDATTDVPLPTAPAPTAAPPPPKSVNLCALCSCRKVFAFAQQTIAMVAVTDRETAIKLYLEAMVAADKFGVGGHGDADEFVMIAKEFVMQSFKLYESQSPANTDANAGAGHPGALQRRCIVSIIGKLSVCRSFSSDDYNKMTMKTAQYAAKMPKKSDQCEMVALCSHLFFVVDSETKVDLPPYNNPQRCLECLQRALKLADSCASANPASVGLFVDLLEHYLFFFEKKNPSITGNYISGLLALIQEHVGGGDAAAAATASPASVKSHFAEIVRYIKRRKAAPETSESFGTIDVGSINST